MEGAGELIGIFGGSFDPPHVGHVLAVHYVLMTQPVSKVLVIPTAHHPFAKQQTPFEHRLEMCRLAFATLGSRVEVLDIESRRGGPSYTVDTVRELKREFPGSRFLLVAGSDILREINRWKESEELQRLAELFVLQRLEANICAEERDQESPYYLPRISSTVLREMISAGREPSTHIPRQVLDYIQRLNLYRSGTPE